MYKKTKLSRICQLLFLLLLAFSILRSPARACSYAALALQLWFEKMIPSLFPFMVISGLIVRLRFGSALSRPIRPFLGRLYRINGTMCTTLLSGFLFGFPLGAKTVAEQYRFGQLTKPQAQYLLSFCNNIGPVYMLSFALPLLGLSGNVAKISSSGEPAFSLSSAFSAVPAFSAASAFPTASADSASAFLTGRQLLPALILLLYFGIPLIYGLVLRYTAYQSFSFSNELSDGFSDKKSGKSTNEASLHAASHSKPASAKHRSKHAKVPTTRAASFAVFPKTPASVKTPMSPVSPVPSSSASSPAFIPALDDSVTSACAAITRLGGYMVFFMVCNMIPEMLLQSAPGHAALSALIAIMLEITSGLSLAKNILPLPLLLTMLTFGGISCFAQTYTCIRETDLSFGNYCFHKLLQTFIAFCLYSLLFSVF